MIEMIDWDEVNRTEDEDSLREVKLWLFQENIRLENRRRELDEQNRRNLLESKRLKEESLFFDRKMEILKDGFRKLDADRRDLERQRKALARERSEQAPSRRLPENTPALEATVQLMFRGADNSLALRKRYRDLVKIFHPDNLFGDGELAQMINREYLKRRGDER